MGKAAIYTGCLLKIEILHLTHQISRFSVSPFLRMAMQRRADALYQAQRSHHADGLTRHEIEQNQDRLERLEVSSLTNYPYMSLYP